MIKVNKNGNVIKITGHSGYDNAGKDIVCASVSSIIYTTVNGLLNICLLYTSPSPRDTR